MTPQILTPGVHALYNPLHCSVGGNSERDRVAIQWLGG